MRPSTLLTYCLCCLAPSLALAQAPAPTPPAAGGQGEGKVEQKIENIHHEDAGSKIDELRVGGETKRITVKPKGDAPAYELGTEGANRNPATNAADQKGGTSGWKVLDF